MLLTMNQVVRGLNAKVDFWQHILLKLDATDDITEEAICQQDACIYCSLGPILARVGHAKFRCQVDVRLVVVLLTTLKVWKQWLRSPKQLVIES